MHLYFSRKKIFEKYVCLPCLKFLDLLPKTHLFFIDLIKLVEQNVQLGMCIDQPGGRFIGSLWPNDSSGGKLRL